jgi:FAD/FMN-containing dehydrogenase
MAMSIINIHFKFWHRHGRLSWHQGRLPEDEIWIKVGGDKGGGTFKMAIQIVNVLHPNSPNNTCVFCIFQGPDSVTNLTVMAHRFQEQVDALESRQWK